MARRGLETPHNGVIFRSRTEAKWAFFWDKLGVTYDYEPQGWDTDGQWYLPDFVVFGALGTLWVEVKPTYEADPAGVAKFRRVAAQRPQPSRAVLLIGPPRAEALEDWEQAPAPSLGPVGPYQISKGEMRSRQQSERNQACRRDPRWHN